MVNQTALSGRVLGELSDDGAVISRYIYANGRHLAMLTGDGEVYYYHLDPLGSPVVITNSSGDVVKNYHYYPFGRVSQEMGSLANTHKFTGKELDNPTAFYYFGARYYDPGIGRFITPDPSGPNFNDPQTLNPYVYCTNNPVKYIDPDGKYRIIPRMKFDPYTNLPQYIYYKVSWDTRTKNILYGIAGLIPGVSVLATGRAVSERRISDTEAVIDLGLEALGLGGKSKVVTKVAKKIGYIKGFADLLEAIFGGPVDDPRVIKEFETLTKERRGQPFVDEYELIKVIEDIIKKVKEQDRQEQLQKNKTEFEKEADID